MPVFEISHGDSVYEVTAPDRKSALAAFSRVMPVGPGPASPAPDTPRTAPSRPTIPQEGSAPDVLAALLPPPKPKVDSTRPGANLGRMAGLGQQPVGANAVLQSLFPRSKPVSRQAPGKVAGQEAGTAPDMSGAFAPWHEPAPSVMSEAPTMGAAPQSPVTLKKQDSLQDQYAGLADEYRAKAEGATGEEKERLLRLASRFDKQSKRQTVEQPKTAEAGWKDMGGGIQLRLKAGQ